MSMRDEMLKGFFSGRYATTAAARRPRAAAIGEGRPLRERARGPAASLRGRFCLHP